MKLRHFILLCPIAFVMACSSDTDQKPLTLRERIGEKLRREYSAESYSYGEKSSNIFASIFDYSFKFTLQDPKSLSGDVSIQDEVQGVALTLYHYLPDSIRELKSTFEVHLKTGGNDITQNYSSYDLSAASDVFEAVPAFIRWASDTAGSDVLDHQYFNDSERSTVKEKFLDALPGTGKVTFAILKFESRDNSHIAYHSNNNSSYPYSSYNSYDSYSSDILFTVHCTRGTSETDLYIEVSSDNHLVNYIHTGALDDDI